MTPYIILIPDAIHRDGKFRPDVRYGEHDGTRLRWRRLIGATAFPQREGALLAAQMAADRTAKRHPDKTITIRSVG